jgi:hypothetical protein
VQPHAKKPSSICGQWRVVADMPMKMLQPLDCEFVEEVSQHYASCTGFIITITDTSFITNGHDDCLTDADVGVGADFQASMRTKFRFWDGGVRTFEQDSDDIADYEYCYWIYTNNKVRKAHLFRTNYEMANCEGFGNTLAIYQLNDNELLIPFCGEDLLVLKRDEALR